MDSRFYSLFVLYVDKRIATDWSPAKAVYLIGNVKKSRGSSRSVAPIDTIIITFIIIIIISSSSNSIIIIIIIIKWSFLKLK
jgi:hypothetical protein